MYRLIYSFLFTLIYFCSLNFVFAQSLDSVSDSDLKVKMIEELIIGGDQSLPLESSLGDPESIFTDSKSNIYVADTEFMDIRVFNENGNYLRSIGERGRGPGEFLSIGYAFINNNDEIFVTDPHQFRVTKYNTKGKVLDTYYTSKKSQDINFFRQAIPLKNGSFLVLYKQSGSGRFAKYASDNLFHVWDSTFQKKIAAYGSFRQLDYTEPFGKGFIEDRIGTMIKRKDDNLLLAPYLYRGKIYRYNKTSNGWEFKNILKAYESKQKSSITLDRDYPDDPEIISRYSFKASPVHGKVNVLSSGLFYLNKKYIVHFSIRKRKQEDDDNWTFGVELINNKNKFLGYYPLETSNNIYTKYEPLVFWKDEKGRFYKLGQVNSVPAIKIFSLEIKKQ